MTTHPDTAYDAHVAAVADHAQMDQATVRVVLEAEAEVAKPLAITVWAPTSIRQTPRERLAELIRSGGLRWHREHNVRRWREKPYADGIVVDLDSRQVVDTIVDVIISGSDPDGRTA